MNDLERYFNENQGNMIHKWQHYFEIYERHFSRFRNAEVHVLEFGISHGGSLKMWENYFGKKAHIYGVDINPECQKFEEGNIHVYIGDQEDKKFLQSLMDCIPKVDILIDDGGHTMKQQINTFELMFSHVADDGVYLCEDLQTSYSKSFGGGYKKKGTFIEYSKGLIDQINAWHFAGMDKKEVSSFTKTAQSLHFYDGILVIEKRLMAEPFHIQKGIPAVKKYKPPRRLTHKIKKLLKR